MTYTVHHGITGTRYGKPLDTEAKANRYAKRLSRSLSHTLDIRNDGTTVSWAFHGEITAETRILEGC